MKHEVIIALGSNSNPQANTDAAIAALGKAMEISSRSERIWTAPIGIKAGRFLNSMIAGSTDMELDKLTMLAKGIERACGRNKADTSRGIVCIDIDILKYDRLKLHTDDWERGYIKQLARNISDNDE